MNEIRDGIKAEREAKTDEAFANYDLKAEAPEARNPHIRFAFEFPALLEMFIPADEIALASRRASRISGIFAVALVLGALLLASLGPLFAGIQHASQGAAASDSHAAPSAGGAGLSTHTIIGLFATAFGLGGTVLGLSGLRRSASRRKWLHARLTTETLRLYHFHHIAARLPEIVAVGDDEMKRKKYLDERAAAFERLKTQVLADPEAELRRIVVRGEETRFESIMAMLPEEGADIPPAAQDAFAAWRVLRVDWQSNYCTAKLEHRHKNRLTIKQLEEIFIGVGWFCVAAIILIHAAHFIGALAQFSSSWLEAAVIWIALIALAGRALEDGFQPQREIERYEQYRANVRVATERFETAQTFAAKLDAMRAFERTSLEEMRVFLRTHARARFLL